MSSELSGRVSSLESQVTRLTQDMLQKLDLVGASNLSLVWNQQFDLIDTNITNIKEQIATLQSLYSNLYLTVQTHYGVLTGHTGSTGLHS